MGLSVVLPEEGCILERCVLYRAAGRLALRLEGERDRLEGAGPLLLLLLLVLLLLLLLLKIYVEGIGVRKGVCGRIVRCV